MRNNIMILLITCLLSVAQGFAQVAVPKKSPEAQQKANDRAEYGNFHKQIMALKEFSEERKKIPRLTKENKVAVKVIATIDSADTEGDTSVKTLTGYITLQIGDNAANIFEVIFDRKTKAITSVKKTAEAEAAEAEQAEVKEKPEPKKTEAKKPATKKNKDEDGDDDDDEKIPPSKDKDKDSE